MHVHNLCPFAKHVVWHCRYYMMYAVSPFERNMNEAGGSLALAVIKYVVTSLHLPVAALTLVLLRHQSSISIRFQN